MAVPPAVALVSPPKLNPLVLPPAAVFVATGAPQPPVVVAPTVAGVPAVFPPKLNPPVAPLVPVVAGTELPNPNPVEFVAATVAPVALAGVPELFHPANAGAVCFFFNF